MQVFRRDIVHALRKKRPGVPHEQFILHLNNASSHTVDTIALHAAVLGFATLFRGSGALRFFNISYDYGKAKWGIVSTHHTNL